MTRLTDCGLESGPKVATGLVERYNQENMTLKKKMHHAVVAMLQMVDT